MKIRLIALLLALPLLAGCSLSLIGGRHQTTTYVFSDANSTSDDMEADSATSDFLKDFLRDNTVPIQGEPGVNPQVGGQTPTTKTQSPALDPDDSTAKPPVIPGDSYRYVQGTFLFKIDEGGTHTVVLDPDPDQQTLVVIGKSGTEYPMRYTGLGNPVGGVDRAHFRAATIIRDFPATVHGSQSWTVGP